MTATELPEHVAALIEGSIIAQFATVSAAGVPIDTPTYCFPADELSHIGVATGLSYPAKAERARRNPKVGLLFEGAPEEPVVLIRGMAAVRDANLQANAERYLSETGFEGVGKGMSWDKAKQAIWYWTRIIVEITPERVMWWDNAAAMDGAPQVWTPSRTSFPESDPAPEGKGSAPSPWPQRRWQELAAEAVARSGPGHLTLKDADGWPLPVRARAIEFQVDRFRLVLPKGIPWVATGPATLTFMGLETFVGTVEQGENESWLIVERALPQNPLIVNPAEVLQPTDETREKLLSRLKEETERRGQPIPALGAEPPALTRLAEQRREKIAAFTTITGE